MPTGYTHAISEGITFKQFAMSCARAFGALVMMRDDPSDTPIPEEFKPQPYYSESLDKAMCELHRLEQMDDAEAAKAARKSYEDAEKYRLDRIAESVELERKYKAMLAQVNAWTPPTSEHENLKNFMIEQIADSMRFDCGTEYYEKPTLEKTGRWWLEDQIKSARENVEMATKSLRDEIKRTKERNEWISALRKSLV